MKLHFFGGAKVVTGANYLLEVGPTKIIVDCGLFQGPPELDELNYQPFPYNPKDIDYVFITHSHLDHCGRLAKLVKEGFKGPIICTPPTRDLMSVALEDALHLMSQEARKKRMTPLFDKVALKKLFTQIKTYIYGQEINLQPNIKFTLRDSGHILGSSMIEFQLKEKNKKITIVFCGDIGNPPTPLLNPPAKIKKTDYILVDSAYGDRNHESKKERKNLLVQAIKDACLRRGVLLIPSFAIERTQELLYELNDLVENKLIPQLPIFIDSPLAIKITNIYQKYPQYFNQKTRYLISTGDDIFKFPGLRFTANRQASKNILRVQPPKIIIAGSGMSTGGRILFHEKQYLSNPNNMFLVIGFQVEGTLGRKILEGTPVVNVLREPIKNKIEVRAIGAYSAHADQKLLLKFIKQIARPIKKVIAVQGEKKAAETLAKVVQSKLKIVAVAPKYEDVMEL